MNWCTSHMNFHFSGDRCLTFSYPFSYCFKENRRKRLSGRFRRNIYFISVKRLCEHTADGHREAYARSGNIFIRTGKTHDIALFQLTADAAFRRFQTVIPCLKSAAVVNDDDITEHERHAAVNDLARFCGVYLCAVNAFVRITDRGACNAVGAAVKVHEDLRAVRNLKRTRIGGLAECCAGIGVRRFRNVGIERLYERFKLVFRRIAEEAVVVFRAYRNTVEITVGRGYRQLFGEGVVADGEHKLVFSRLCFDVNRKESRFISAVFRERERRSADSGFRCRSDDAH